MKILYYAPTSALPRPMIEARAVAFRSWAMVRIALEYPDAEIMVTCAYRMAGQQGIHYRYEGVGNDLIGRDIGAFLHSLWDQYCTMLEEAERTINATRPKP